jgi:hypothetical protein
MADDPQGPPLPDPDTLTLLWLEDVEGELMAFATLTDDPVDAIAWSEMGLRSRIGNRLGRGYDATTSEEVLEALRVQKASTEQAARR